MDRIRKDGTPAKLSTDLTNMVVHKKSEASYNGRNTNSPPRQPHTKCKNWSGTNPVRVLIDQTLRLPRPLCIFSTNKFKRMYLQLEKRNQQTI